jgi:hypothetical protein
MLVGWAGMHAARLSCKAHHAARCCSNRRRSLRAAHTRDNTRPPADLLCSAACASWSPFQRPREHSSCAVPHSTTRNAAIREAANCKKDGGATGTALVVG